MIKTIIVTIIATIIASVISHLLIKNFGTIHDKLQKKLTFYQRTIWWKERTIKKLDYSKWKKEFIDGYNKGEVLPYYRKSTKNIPYKLKPTHLDSDNYRPLNKLLKCDKQTKSYKNGREILRWVFLECYNKPSLDNIKIQTDIYI
jgi:hypothetical protein